ncbi:hypothetical protein QYE76_066022 [Lolium multiflorum]|uniref:Bifunctional inhibitor/plant lipid transfer protein/seed storage helical domain-containing protein n=1 Tax=Lolium multiflorum TaxID=4521 RepID=A0AAD8S9U6_LOLMU|nr:hypothetical protein QYE76_066022 [Lolium multiflorum]
MKSIVVAVVALAALVAIAAAAGGSAEAESAAACNPSQLTPCAGPTLFGGPVPPACCGALRAQMGCLCGYARSPNYGAYIHSPNARRLFDVCRIPMPRCA